VSHLVAATEDVLLTEAILGNEAVVAEAGKTPGSVTASQHNRLQTRHNHN